MEDEGRVVVGAEGIREKLKKFFNNLQIDQTPDGSVALGLCSFLLATSSPQALLPKEQTKPSHLYF